MASFPRQPMKVDAPPVKGAPLVQPKPTKAVEIYTPPTRSGGAGGHERIDIDHDHPTVRFHARWHAWRAALIAGGVGLITGFLTNEWVHRSINREAVSVAADAVGSGVAIGSARREAEGDENGPVDYGDDKGVANRGHAPKGN